MMNNPPRPPPAADGPAAAPREPGAAEAGGAGRRRGRGGRAPDIGRRPVQGELRTPVAVVQPLPGIGDMVWHVPHIRAIAEAAGAPVTLLAKPRALAGQLLAGEPAVRAILRLDLNPGGGRRGAHDGVTGLVRLARLLRGPRFGSVILLHHSASIAAAAWLAGIPQRLGYGWGGQHLFLNAGPFLPREVAGLHQHARATRFLEATGIPLADAEPTLAATAASRADIRCRLGHGEAFVAVGIGSSEPLRQWGVARFTELVAALLDAGWPRIVLLGGPDDASMAEAIRAGAGERAQRVATVLGWHLTAVAALLAEAAFYVGNNTGVMNMAAAVGTRTYALFGTTPPFRHASQIVAITAPDAGVHDGMARLPLDVVLAAIRADRGQLAPRRADGAPA